MNDERKRVKILNAFEEWVNLTCFMTFNSMSYSVLQGSYFSRHGEFSAVRWDSTFIVPEGLANTFYAMLDIWLLDSIRSKKVLIEWVYRKLSLIYISALARKCNCNCHLYCSCECSCKCCCTCSIKCERECKPRPQSRNLVVSIDGTSNQFGLNVSRHV